MGNDILRAGNKCSFVLCISKIKNFSSSPSCTSNMVFFRGARERFFLVYQNCLCTKVNWNSIRFFCYSSYHGMMQLIFNSTLVVLRGNFQLCLGDNICLTTVRPTNSFISKYSLYIFIKFRIHSDFSFLSGWNQQNFSSRYFCHLSLLYFAVWWLHSRSTSGIFFHFSQQ